MSKRIIMILLALCILFSVQLCYADDLSGPGGIIGFDEEQQKQPFMTVSTYNIETFQDGDFCCKWNDEKTGIILTSYVGENPDVVFPDTVTSNQFPVVAIDHGMCQDSRILEHITIPGSIKTIGNNAFARCKKLESVVLEEGVEELGFCSFGGCDDLKEVQLPDSLKIVNLGVFANCIALEEVAFGTQLTSIGPQAFSGCLSLLRITVPGGDSVTMGPNLFDKCPNEVKILN